MKRLLTAAFAALFAASLCVPAGALAQEAPAPATEGEHTPVLPDAEHPLTGMSAAPEDEPTTLPDEVPSDTAMGCCLTFNYYEVVWYDDDTDLLMLGQYVVDDVKPGQVVNVWDYVFDIPGHYFFDGTAPSITICDDNEKNVIDLLYGKLYNSEFTVNYYLMNGANLMADNWSDALLPTTTFHKMGEQTFVDQRFDMEVKGDEFEHEVPGLYVVDSFPESIRLSLEPEDNVLNILYVPSAVNLPDDAEMFEVPDRPGDVMVPTPIDPTPDSVSTAGSNPAGILESSTSLAQSEGIAFVNGNLETGDFDGPIAFTEEMIANPILPETAQRYADAFETGGSLTVSLPVIESTQPIQVGAALILFLIAFIAVCAYAFERDELS